MLGSLIPWSLLAVALLQLPDDEHWLRLLLYINFVDLALKTLRVTHLLEESFLLWQYFCDLELLVSMTVVDPVEDPCLSVFAELDPERGDRHV